ncbi:MAG: phosphoenolpyruvate-protein phosphotransferase system enzyme [Candidatus Cloacimonadota bacterium]|jgi:phosphotransferase system enzyme I (PtsI)|nr:phosphoenolpyruvate-protein phosphotransferase system enzyme [Candidatus Cloacimonadota bacterium]
MKECKGIPVSEGIGIGKAKFVTKPKFEIKKKNISEEEVDSELERFNTNLENVLQEMDYLIQNFSHSKDNQDILHTHKMILTDPEFIAKIEKMISQELMSLEQAIKKHFTDIIAIFNNMENQYYADRSSDYEDVAQRFLKHSMNLKGLDFSKIDKNSIIFVDKISPSEVTRAYECEAQGIVLREGSKNSHSAIIARSMGLPMVVCLGHHDNISENEMVILDGRKGKIFANPDEKTLQKYSKLQEEETTRQKQLQKLKDKEAITKDGQKVGLMSNIEIPEEIVQVIQSNSAGIGLFRTEFLFIDRKNLPTEDEQYKIYKKIAEKISPHPLIIRTIDVGGDKLSSILNIEHELNPNLGCRGIRLSFENIPIFKTQLKAILRANTTGNIKIMFPMVSCVQEVINAKKIIEECKQELEEVNNIEIGAMVEIPSAALNADIIAKECDFLSIGTNDLIQYTLAVDRDNQTVAKYYKPTHPSVLQLIKLTAEKAHKHQVKVAVCGEMASQEEYVGLLLGLGVDELSVSPAKVLSIKEKIRNADIKEQQKRAEKILQMSTAEEVMDFLEKE